MLNPFPIQFLALFGYFIIRIVIGLCFIYLAKKHWGARNELYTVLKLNWFPFGKMTTLLFISMELLIGLMFSLGWYTQIAALLTLTMSLKMLVLRNRFVTPHLPNRLTYFLIFGISCLLFITGGGIFAFDLPI